MSFLSSEAPLIDQVRESMVPQRAIGSRCVDGKLSSTRISVVKLVGWSHTPRTRYTTIHHQSCRGSLQMPIQLEFLHEGLGVIYRCEGALRLQHFVAANDQLLASPGRIRKLKYILVDGASMEPTFFSPTEMAGIVLQDRQIASYAVPGLLVALVVKREVVFALARMWEAFIEGIGWETKIFPSIADAQDWVRTRVKDKFKLDLPYA
jgi:hypothetical protein